MRMTATYARRLEPLILTTTAAAALSIRVAIGGRPAGASETAALAFSAALLSLAVAAGWRPARLRCGDVAVGVAGAAVLCAPPVIAFLHGNASGPDAIAAFPTWASVVAAVAVTEEIVLRGVLYNALARISGDAAAVIITALLFALMHVPLYGWGSFVLNVAVGGWLGTLRLVTGSVTAPAVAHTVADWAAWWLR